MAMARVGRVRLDPLFDGCGTLFDVCWVRSNRAPDRTPGPHKLHRGISCSPKRGASGATMRNILGLPPAFRMT
jgi:hypothetical protein